MEKIFKVYKLEYPLISPTRYESRDILFDAAKVRNHIPILNIVRQLGEGWDGGVPKIFYHWKNRIILQ